MLSLKGRKTQRSWVARPESGWPPRRCCQSGTPVGRNGTAEDVAQAIAALIENDYITGVVLRRRAPAHLNRPDASPVAAGDAG